MAAITTRWLARFSVMHDSFRGDGRKAILDVAQVAKETLA